MKQEKCNHKWDEPNEWYGDFDEYRILTQTCEKCGLVHAISGSRPGFFGRRIYKLDKYIKSTDEL